MSAPIQTQGSSAKKLVALVASVKRPKVDARMLEDAYRRGK